jgi:hypothetical protein
MFKSGRNSVTHSSFPVGTGRIARRNIGAHENLAGGAGLRRRLAALLVATALSPALMPLLPQNALLPGISMAQAAENVSIDRIEIATGFGTIVLNQIAVANSSLPRAEIEALLKADTLVGLADRLEKFDADRLAIRSLVITMKVAGSESVTTYENLEAKGIKRGAIAQLSIVSGKQDSQVKDKDKEAKLQSTIGRMTIDALDLVASTRWLTDADPSGNAPMKRLHGHYSIASMQFSSKDQFTGELGKIEGDFFEARLPRRPMVELFPEMMNAEKSKDDPNVIARLFAGMIDVYGSFTFGPVTIGTMKVHALTPEGQADVEVGKFAFGGGDKPYGKMIDFAVKTKEGYFRAKEMGGTGDLYGAILAGIARGILLGADTMGARKDGAEARTLTPDSRALLEKAADAASAKLKSSEVGISIQTVEADVPPSKGSTSKGRVKFSMAGFEATAGSFIDLSPTKIGLALKNFSMPIPADATDKSLVTLRGYGLDALGLSAAVKAQWAEAGSTLSIPEISVDMDKMARVTLKGEFGGVPRTFFESPSKNWPMLLGTANIKRLDVSVINRGGLDKVVAKAAEDQGKKPDQFRFEMAAMAPAMIAAVMSSHPDAQKLSKEVGTFIQSLKGLDVSALAVSPAGITVPEIMAASQNPGTLLPKVKFQANGQ